MSNEELATKLGDLNAYLADAFEGRGVIDDCLMGHDVIEDIEKAYAISNELYTEFVQYDINKEG